MAANIQNAVGIFFFFWAIYLLFFTLPAAAMFYFGRARVTWGRYDYMVAAVPYIIWITLFFLFPGRKDIGNVVEPLLIGMVTPSVLLIRLLYGKRKGERTLSIIDLVACCAFSVVMFLTTEKMGE